MRILPRGIALLALIFCALPRTPLAQSSPADSARLLFALADSAAKVGSAQSLQRAVEFGTRALAVQERLADRRGQGKSLQLIADSYLALQQLDSSLVFTRRSIVVWKELADSVGAADAASSLGIIFYYQGQLDSALAHWQEARAISERIRDRGPLSATLNNIGAVFRSLGKPDSARAYHHQALAIARELHDRRRETAALGSLGILFGSTGKPDSALLYFRPLLLVGRELKDRRSEQKTLANLGLVHWHLGQRDSARFYFQGALRLARDLGDRHGEGTTLHNLGNLYQEASSFDSAAFYYRGALTIARATGDRDGEGMTLSNLGVVYRTLSQFDSALVTMRKALAIIREVKNVPAEATALHALALVHGELEWRDSTLAYFARALALSRQLGDRESEGETLSDMATFYYRGTPHELAAAVAYYDSAATARAAVGARAGGDFNRMTLGERQLTNFEGWSFAWAARAREVGAKPAALAALAAAERGRAQALLDLMRDTTARVEPGADLPAEGARLAAMLRRSHSGGLVYFSTSDTLVTWVISSSGEVEIFRRAIARDTLAALVGAFRVGLGGESGNARLVLRGAPLEPGAVRGSGKNTATAGAAWRRRADELTTILLPPEVLRRLAREKEVVIVPQGALALVPFAGLPVGAAGEPFGSKLAIRYAPSLATLSKAEERSGLGQGEARDRSLKEALVVGNPTMPEVRVSDGTRDRLSPLPGAEAESRGIATQLGTKPLTGAAATETEVVRRLANAPLVHLATHGFAYSTEANARSSFVSLAPDSQSDGLLTVGKILDNSELKLSAELVVLSACQTALGDLKQAEGTVGLQRAFFAKGARSVLVSLWNVSDAATGKLMTGFYQHWLRDPDHPSKAEALRRSQEETRKTQGFEHPRFWAGFQLVGAK